jgi:hypothetical protein
LKITRAAKIQEIIDFLKKEKEEKPFFHYSIDQNIIFFRSISTHCRFLRWYWKNMYLINSSQLTELTDFENEDFREELHYGLLKIERRSYPGLTSPLVKTVFDYISNLKKPVLVGEMGSGSLEVVRQLILRILKRNINTQITFIAFDKVYSSSQMALENLASLKEKIEIYKTNYLTVEYLNKVNDHRSKNIIVILVQKDIFDLNLEKQNIKFDVIYHSFFKHHIENINKPLLDLMIKKISLKSFEYDDFRSSLGVLIHAFYTWKNPVLMNGAVFSILRSPTLNSLKQTSDSLKIYGFGLNLAWRGTYLREY